MHKQIHLPLPLLAILQRLELLWPSPQPVHPQWFNVMAALLLSVQLNQHCIEQIMARVPGQLSLQLSLFLLLPLLNFLLMWLVSLAGIQKSGFLFLAFVGAVSCYFMDSFGVLMDKSMLQNALETDIAEASGLLSGAMFIKVTGLMILPIFLCWWLPVRSQTTKQKLIHTLVSALIWLVITGSVLADGRAELIPFFRNFRDIKHMALPLAPISAAISVSQHWLKELFPTQLTKIGEDAVLPANAHTGKPRLLILVLGETARADHFQLNGYERATNPQLSQLPVVSFRQVYSCGTATAHSVPCMFSLLDQEHYNADLAKNSENVLDVLQRSGVAVKWLDNNSGCKRVCDRVPSKMLFEDKTNPLCHQGQCQDEILLQALRLELAEPLTQDRVLVIHQLGSHGPEYFRRSTNKQKKFLPECTDKQIQFCDVQSIKNAYDNSLIATDELLANVIRTLQQQHDYQAAMLYISDHGESLGENGTYLHGLPYWMAPQAQTHVPMIWWMSEEFEQKQGLSLDCIRESRDTQLSHDYLFHSLLGSFAVQTQVYQPSLDFLQQCRRRSN
jgi:lipid A ethanolaminephosphotransferase